MSSIPPIPVSFRIPIYNPLREGDNMIRHIQPYLPFLSGYYNNCRSKSEPLGLINESAPDVVSEVEVRNNEQLYGVKNEVIS